MRTRQFFFLEKAQAWALGALGPNPLSGPQGSKQSSNKNMGFFFFLGPSWAFWALWAAWPSSPVRIPELKKSRMRTDI